jgi:hypothetical protein
MNSRVVVCWKRPRVPAVRCEGLLCKRKTLAGDPALQLLVTMKVLKGIKMSRPEAWGGIETVTAMVVKLVLLSVRGGPKVKVESCTAECLESAQGYRYGRKSV